MNHQKLTRIKRLLFLTLIMSVNVTAQNERSFSVKRIVFTVTKTNIDQTAKYCFGIKESLNENIKSDKKEVCDYLDKPDQQKFEIFAMSTMKKIVPDSFLTNNKDEISKKLDEIFGSLENSDIYEKIEYGKDIYYGLSTDEIELLELKKDSLKVIQNQIRKARTWTLPHKVKKFYDDDLKSSSEFQKQKSKQQQGTISSVDDYKSVLRADRKRLKRDIYGLFDKRIPSISLIGNANVVASFKVLDQTQANAGFGVIISKPLKYDFLGIITVAETSDTVVSSDVKVFGQSVLTPGVRRFSLLTSYRSYSIAPLSGCRLLRKLGFVFNANVTPYQWAIKTEDGVKDSIAKKAIPVSVDVMFPFTWVLVYKENKDISVSTDFGFTFRFLAGNLNEEARNSFLGRGDLCYPGLIFGLNFKYNGLRVQFHGPIFFGKRVDGLTGGQVYASIGFVANILSNESNVLRKNRNE